MENKTNKRVKPHRAAASPKSSGAIRGQNSLSGDVVINITMNALNMLQEKFGTAEFVRAPGDEPAIYVFPKSLDVCLECGILIVRNGVPYCTKHKPVESQNVIPELETQVA